MENTEEARYRWTTVKCAVQWLYGPARGRVYTGQSFPPPEGGAVPTRYAPPSPEGAKWGLMVALRHFPNERWWSIFRGLAGHLCLLWTKVCSGSFPFSVGRYVVLLFGRYVFCVEG